MFHAPSSLTSLRSPKNVHHFIAKYRILYSFPTLPCHPRLACVCADLSQSETSPVRKSDNACFSDFTAFPGFKQPNCYVCFGAYCTFRSTSTLGLRVFWYHICVSPLSKKSLHLNFKTLKTTPSSVDVIDEFENTFRSWSACCQEYPLVVFPHFCIPSAILHEYSSSKQSTSSYLFSQLRCYQNFILSMKRAGGKFKCLQAQ